MAPLRCLPTSPALGEALVPPLCGAEFPEQPPPATARTATAAAAGATRQRCGRRTGEALVPRPSDTQSPYPGEHSRPARGLLPCTGTP